ncbi:hypothetical protein SASPL_156933 [Salvia splendens]|uniref:Cyclic nucleotide-binding domain-containing protein n=1 Tax=Salvia splendens TaxID=180675 RepID=A0A8X8VVS3_SALSN|nr:hypothetical protein SASPL_156933 [Salvia splendens]
MERSRNRAREEDDDNDSETDEQRYSVEDLDVSSKSWRSKHPFNLLRNYSSQASFNFRHSQSHGFIIRPDNRWYVAWSHFILVWAIYSSFFTPLEFAFFRGLPENLFLLDVAASSPSSSTSGSPFSSPTPIHTLTASSTTATSSPSATSNLDFSSIFSDACPGMSSTGAVEERRCYADFRHIDLWTRYITALYFSVVTMATVGYGEIHAVNTREMIFVMLYVSLDMILGAYLLGNMTALIVKGSKTERFRDKMAELIKYMNRNKLGKSISKEIKGHVRLQYESSYSDASALQDLPLSLRAKISNKLYEPNIRQVTLFNGCSDGFIKKIAIKVHEEFFLPGEVIVEEGTTSDQLYFLCDGKLEQVRNQEEEGSVPATIPVNKLSRLLRVDKQSLVQVIEIHFADGRVIIDNLLHGREHHHRKKILESAMAVQIERCESELAMRLNCAANDGDLHRLRHLVEAGADPNKTDYHGQSPLHCAAAMVYEDIVQFLIQIDANINLRDNYGKPRCLRQSRTGMMARRLCWKKRGCTGGGEARDLSVCEAVARNELDFVTRLLANGINPNSKNYNLQTPLHLAAAEGLSQVSVVLLQNGASVFAADRWGRTPLDEARVGGDHKLVQLLEDAKRTQMTEFSSASNTMKINSEGDKDKNISSETFSQKIVDEMDDLEEDTKRVDGEESGEMKTPVVAGINLVLMMSFLSLSEEGGSNIDEIQEIETSDSEHKYTHGIQARRQQVNRLPTIERQTTSRVHTKIRDSRHCRRF